MSAGAGAQTLSYPSTAFPGPVSTTIQIPAESSVGGPDAGAEYLGIQRVMQTVRVTR
jgi:hypothetical protein